jgi:ABC-type enterochelin transport system permease subunit
MDLIPDFCRRKHGERFDYPDPRTEDILSETYGIMVYQEQVMQMAQVIGGYSLGGADLLARGLRAPLELPVGVLTAILGGGYMLFLMRGMSTKSVAHAGGRS